jgi:hypothetical protein
MECNGKEILNIRTRGFDGVWHELYCMVMEDEEPVSSHPIIEPFIGKLQTSANGIGLDVADYLKTKNDLLFFADIFEEGIKRYKERAGGTLPDYFEIPLNDFVKEIRNYAHSLPDTY